MSSEVQVNIGQDLIGPIVEAKIQAAITSSLTNPKDLVNEMITRILSQKCDAEGKVNSYSSYNKYTMVDMVCRNALQRATKAAMEEWVSENTKLLKDTLKKQIAASPAKFAKVFLDGLAGSLKSSWAFKVSIGTDD